MGIKMYLVNPIHCLVHLACQTETSDKLLSYVKNIKGTQLYKFVNKKNLHWKI